MTRLLRPAETTDATCGPKAAVLGRALAAGLPVPLFVVLPADAYCEHLARAGAGGNPTATRDAILGTPVDSGLLGELRAALGELGPRVAVRSSGTAEDLPGLSFAGQYETVLDVDAGSLERAVLECWASVWGDRAVAYRERNKISHDAAAMAVIVQTFVAADSGGVAFTADPVTGQRTVVVESAPGGAEAIVSGRVSPERATFARAELEVAADSDAGAALADLPRAVARLALAAEQLLGTPADIEWAFAGGTLWLLQARPITTGVVAEVASAESGSGGSSDASAGAGCAPRTASEGLPEPAVTARRYRPTAWSNVNTGEVLPDVVTPMTWSIVGKLATGLIDSLFGKLGIRVDYARLTGLIAGRAYFNASLLGSAFEQMPMRGESDITSVFGGHDAPPGFADLPLAPEDTARVSTARVLLGVPLVGLWFLQHTPRQARRLCVQIREQTDARLREIAVGTTEDDLANVTSGIVRELDTMVDAIAFSGVAMASHSRFVAAAKRHFGADEGPAFANVLLAGQGGVASADAGLSLARLGRTARTHPAVADIVRTTPRWADARPLLESLGSDGATFLAEWDAFLAEYGHHARGELEFASPRWSETPDDVLSMVVGLLDIPGGHDLLAALEVRGAKAAAEEARALASLGPIARARFRRLLRSARDGARTRENAKSEGVRALAATRQALLALGAKMADRGVLGADDDILFLFWDEVPLVRAGTLDASAIVAARRAEYERNRTLTPPPVIIGEWDGVSVGDVTTPPSSLAPGERVVLTGLGVAAGVARGPARVIRSLRSDERVLPGEVLVAPFTDPGWTPFFIPAAAIVVDMGGMLSHGSIIAREYGIPGVVNVGPGTTTIHTGDLVEVDGSRGVVTIIERRPHED